MAANATGEAESGSLRLQFDFSVKLAFRGSSISSDGGLLLHRELDDALGLTDMAAESIADPRTGKNGRHELAGFLRQSVFSRLAGCEDVNDADRLCRDPVMRQLIAGGGRGTTGAWQYHAPHGPGGSVARVPSSAPTIRQAAWAALIDPLGDLADELLDYIPPWRTDHVVYFNPADTEFPVAFNLLADVPYEMRSVIAAGVVGGFKHIYQSSWGDRLEWILVNAVYALLECPGTTLLGVTRMLQDKEYRAEVLRHVTNPIVRSYWLEEFPRYGKEFAATASSPVQNKVGQFIIAPAVRNIIGQVKSTIDVPFMMDNERIFIANLSKGSIGEKNTNLLGSLLATSFQLTALRRAERPAAERVDFHLYIDEFHNFTTRAFANALSEVRKYRLSLVLAHQYLNQLDEAIRDAVIGNCGSLVSFTVGSTDAEVLARELTPMSAETLVDLGQYEICALRMNHGKFQ